jgi:signal transduction histidine kinase
MARRVFVSLVALIGVLLVAAVVPLGIVTTDHERASFQNGALTSARALASVAEEDLGDHRHDPAVTTSLDAARHDGERVEIFDAGGRRFTGTTGGEPDVPKATLARVLSRRADVVCRHDDRLLAVVPVNGDDPDEPSVVGAVALTRPTGPLDAHVDMLWLYLAIVGSAGLLGAAALAMALARWVGRPLSGLDVAAQRLGEGVLDTRSPAARGPREVRRLAGNFNTMAARLESLVHGHRAMMADVSHQLRTPLAALRLRLDVLGQDADETMAAELAGAQVEVARLSRLVDGLLAVARAEHAVIEPVTLDLDDVVRDRVTAWQPLAEERGVTLLPEGARTTRQRPILARLGAGHIEQILDNLLANALEAAPAGGEIRLRVTGTRETARIVVADNGPGMSAERRASAFRRFTSTTPGGTGLGLAIVHRLAVSNGGTATLSETVGGGLTVAIELPAAQVGRDSSRGADGRGAEGRGNDG